MNINNAGSLAQSLACLAYNGRSLEVPKDKKLNIYMGIGLWSARDGLSNNLPVDIMQMLLSAAVLKSQIREANPEKPSKIILLIADSMAIREGADRHKVAQIVAVYQRAIAHLLSLLNLHECTEIILSSDLEAMDKFRQTHQLIESSDVIKSYPDEISRNYVCTQTAITHYFHTHRDVGVKVGWIMQSSSQKLKDPVIDELPWDELKFDRLHQMICRTSTIQCLYAKAGLKQKRTGQEIQMLEGCPYTAYEKDFRMVVHLEQKKESMEASLPMKSLQAVKRRIAKQWKGVAEVCSALKTMQLVSDGLFPASCVVKNNDVLTICRILDHWSNPSGSVEKNTLTSNL